MTFNIQFTGSSAFSHQTASDKSLIIRW